MHYIALKKRNAAERKAYVDGYKAACNSFLVTLERYLRELQEACDLNVRGLESTVNEDDKDDI